MYNRNRTEDPENPSVRRICVDMSEQYDTSRRDRRAIRGLLSRLNRTEAD